MKGSFYTLSIFILLVFSIVPAFGQQEGALPERKEWWLGTELIDWLRGGDHRSRFIVPEIAAKYRFTPYGAINLQGGYHLVKRDSLYFTNTAYRNEGWFVKGGPELVLVLAQSEPTVLNYVGGINFIYSRFREQAEVSFRYRQVEFLAEIDPENEYRYRGSGTADAFSGEFYQGLWLTHGRFSMLTSASIRYLFNKPDNSFMPVHYIPGFGIRTPQWDLFPFRNRNNLSRNTVFSLQLNLYYRLF